MINSDLYSSDGVSKVNYQSKDGALTKTFDAPVSSTGQALDWPRQRTAGCKHSPQLVTHIPNKGESAGGGSDITDFTLINHVAYAKKPAPMMRSQR